MIEIIPAIMPKDWKDLKKKAFLVSSYVDTVQLDLMDGEFVPEKTWPFSQPTTNNKQQITKEFKNLGVDLELDLMVENASKQLEKFLKMKPKRIIFHIEAEDSLTEMFDNIETLAKSKTEIGLAINTTTDIEEVFPWVSKVDFVQCMGIEEIGFQAQPFDERVIEQIERLREEYPNVTISVDGGVNLETAPQLIEAGVSRLVIGSAIFESKNIGKTIKKFQSLEN